ncbi:dihydroorotate dehydrogenase [Acuticoccus mangrovi]|uniref:Dihydroorotate dehydrogenase n=1 Tax=Acuticoccus mangrovi TaxID=2796142 RepID=A0A934ILZ0_9HYPH|nr:dihydroorotate dehydrogenase [Acuticoccus mangrovi]
MSAVDLSVDIGGLRLKAPVVPASGTFSYAHGRIFPLGRLGALVPKTVMPEPRPGHPAPRLTEEAGGLVNAIGIPSVGTDAFIADVLPRYRDQGAPIVVSASADRVDAFAALVARLSGEGLGAIELNLSCPNLEAGGRAFALDPDETHRAVAACRAATGLPLWCKLSPNAGAPVEVAKAAVAAGGDALIVSNTMLALALDAEGRPRLANRTGGLSGAPVKPVNLRIVDEIASALDVPIIGCGGVASLKDVLDYFAAGASAVAVGTATLSRPSTMIHLIDALADYCLTHGVGVRDLIRRAS